MIEFKLEKLPDEKTGQPVDTIVKYKDGVSEPWCTVVDLDRLFDACVSRWGANWDLNKLVTCIAECEFD